MSFLEELNHLTAKIHERKEHVFNEETTKQSLIIPFLQLLGYDIFDPQEIRPEFVSDFGKKKGEKVDYAIFKDNKAIMFVEAKSISENLEKHSAQIARYFNATHTINLAVLTNGIEYHLFTDLNVVNVMDESPFLRFNILSPSEEALKTMNLLRKECFDCRAIQDMAEELVYAKDIELFLKRQLTDPTNDFIRFILREMIDTRITATVIEKFRPLVRKTILKTMQSMLARDALQPEGTCEGDLKPIKATGKKDAAKAVVEDIAPVSKTQEPASTVPLQPQPEPSAEASDFSLSAFGILKEVMSVEGFESDRLLYKNTPAEMLIYIGLPENWIAKIRQAGESHLMILPLDYEAVAKRLGNLFVYESVTPRETTIQIDHPDNIFKLSRLITNILNRLTMEG